MFVLSLKLVFLLNFIFLLGQFTEMTFLASSPCLESRLDEERWETPAGCGAEWARQSLRPHRKKRPLSHQAGRWGQVSVSGASWMNYTSWFTKFSALYLARKEPNFNGLTWDKGATRTSHDNLWPLWPLLPLGKVPNLWMETSVVQQNIFQKLWFHDSRHY